MKMKLFKKKETEEKGTFFQTTCPECGNRISGNLPRRSFYGEICCVKCDTVLFKIIRNNVMVMNNATFNGTVVMKGKFTPSPSSLKEVDSNAIKSDS